MTRQKIQITTCDLCLCLKANSNYESADFVVGGAAH